MQNTDIIKDKLNILDVVGSYVKLEKSGKTYKGKSPFTNEKTPSFFVSPEKGFFYCFSSGKGGDMFTFVQEIERIDFKEALKILAEKAGVSLENNQQNKEKITKNQIQYRILDDATKWYEIHLRKNTNVVNHLLQRGLTKETIVKYRIGFALDDWSDIYRYLKSRKYTDEDIEAVGLIIKKEKGGYYDRFRSRIIFPLFDGRSRVVGFSGRIFGSETEKSGAKYINSPEGPLFDKSKVLYGYHSAKSVMSKKDFCILVEGQFDVLMSQQSGYINTVAISGTGLTTSHIGMIQRFTNTLLLALDSDNAGIKATRRSVIEAYKQGMNVQVILLQEGMDPADTILKSKTQWDICVSDAQDYIDYRLEIAHRKKDISFIEKKFLVDNDLFTFVSLTKSSVVQDKMLQKIALFLGVSIEAVRNDFTSFTPNENFESKMMLPSEKKPSRQISAQENILYLALYLEDIGISIEPEIKEKQIHLYNDLYNSNIESDTNIIPAVTKNLQLFILHEYYKDTPKKILKDAVYKLLIREKIRIIDQESDILLEELRQAESQKNMKKIQDYMHRQQELLKLKTDLTNIL